MNAFDAARSIGERLDEDQLPYGIGGALALGVWGVPRATKDVDLSVFATASELSRVLDSLERAGVLVDRTAAARDVARIGLFHGRLGRIVIDVFLSDHPQYNEMQRRCHRITDPSGRAMSFISAEDLALHKLVFGRDKDVTDLEGLVAVRPEIDLGYVRRWLVQMVPAGDRRLAVLDDLERRFAAKA